MYVPQLQDMNRVSVFVIFHVSCNCETKEDLTGNMTTGSTVITGDGWFFE